MSPAAAAEAVAEVLQGQCLMDIDQALAQLELPGDLINNMDFCHALDNLVFCCGDCGWWCEASEEADPEETGRPHDTICEDCAD